MDRQEFLADVGPILALPLTFQQRLDRLAQVSVPRLADYCLVDVIEEGGRIARVAAAHADPALADLMAELRQYPPARESGEGIAEVLRTGEPKLMNDLPSDFARRVAPHPRQLEIVRRLRPRCILIVPLVARGHTLGSISFVFSGSGRRFDKEDLGTAQELARFAALVIDNVRLYEEAQRTARAREELLAVVSHELRHPLNAVRLMTGTLLTGLSDVATPQQWSVLAAVGQLAEQTTRLVDDLLDVTQIEARGLLIRPEPLDVAGILREVRAEFTLQMHPTGPALEIVIGGEIPAAIADRARLLQVFRNLLANAADVTPPGGTVSIEASRAAEGILFAVKDQGPAISGRELTQMFDRFWGEAEGASPGTGLGLAICKGIVEAHGGRIWMDTACRTGRRFFFTLPSAGIVVASGSDADERSERAVTASAEVTSESPRNRPASHAEHAVARERGRHLLRVLRGRRRESAVEGDTIAGVLRQQILEDVFTGRLRPGDRLPSIRELSRAMGISKRQTEAAYGALQKDGIAEPRERSGMYVGELSRDVQGPPTETAQWMVDVLAGACEHQIRIPFLPELVHRWTASASLHCACIESNDDSRATLGAELTRSFGLQVTPIDFETLPEPGVAPVLELPPALRNADFWVTTPFHLPRIHEWASELRKPVVVASMHPRTVRAIERHLQQAPLTVVCTDVRFGERVQALFDPSGIAGVDIVLADDGERIAALAKDEPSLMTWAARERLGGSVLRLIAPVLPAYDPAFAGSMSRLLLRLNLEIGRP